MSKFYLKARRNRRRTEIQIECVREYYANIHMDRIRAYTQPQETTSH